jgi:type II secretory ATPase GspE/PulE/Tfp pilus assembly ATPase PilB-like protein
MASPSDDHNEVSLDSSVHQRIVSQFRGDWVSRLNIDQMFVLIDGVLPFEACLYYQVLPLFLEGNRLHLGMVSLDDTSASEYVRRIISYLNYSLVCHSISSEALRVVLTAYLNYVGAQQTAKKSRPESVSYGHHRHSAHVKSNRPLDANERLTLVVDSPDDLYAGEGDGGKVLIPPSSPTTIETPSTLEPAVEAEPESEFQPAPVEAWTLSEPTETEQSIDFSPDPLAPFAPTGSLNEASAETETLETAAEVAPAAKTQPQIQTQVQIAGLPSQALPILHVSANYLSSPVEVLASLPPAELVQELLARVLLGGIGRLYFESHPQHGRVVWSQNGVLQSVLDHLPKGSAQGVIRALKLMARVNPVPVTQSQQTEIEYLYERTRVLLRFRFMPGLHGEEATVQVLRGAALKFYQQQQLNNLERDAMSIAKQLQNKLNEIRAQAYSDPSLLETKLEMIPKLSQVLRHLEEQLDDLGIHLND